MLLNYMIMSHKTFDFSLILIQMSFILSLFNTTVHNRDNQNWETN